MFRNILLTASMSLALVPAVNADQMKGTTTPLGAVRFEADSDVKCLLAAVETGDADTGPSTFILKAPAGCIVPWHFHTAQEQAVVIRGLVKMEMRGSAATLLGPGGFAVMPGKEPHRISCSGKLECLIVVSFDGKYDIVWERGNR